MESWLQANFDVGTVGTEIFQPPNSDFSFTQYQVFQFFQVIFELGSPNFVVICGYLWYVSRIFMFFSTEILDHCICQKPRSSIIWVSVGSMLSYG